MYKFGYDYNLDVYTVSEFSNVLILFKGEKIIKDWSETKVRRKIHTSNTQERVSQKKNTKENQQAREKNTLHENLRDKNRKKNFPHRCNCWKSSILFCALKVKPK